MSTSSPSSTDPSLSTHPGRIGARAWALLAVLCGAVFLEGSDVAMLGIALPSIRADLGLATGSLQWVLSAYALGYGGFVLLGGRAADLFGRRRMFLFWLTVFLLFSGLGGIASEAWMLITARFVTGVAAGFLAPAGLSIITTSFPEGRPRNQALFVYAGIASGGYCLGLVAGGLLTTVHWRWVFFAPVLISLVLLVAAVPLVPRSPRDDRSGRSFDIAGAVSITTATMLLVLTMERAPHSSAAQTAGTLAAALVLLATFALIERRSPAPLVRLGILRSGALVRANLAMLLFLGAFISFQFITVLYLQELRGWSTLATSLAMLAVCVDIVLAPTLTARLVARFGDRRVIVVGLLLAAVSYALFLPLGADWGYAAIVPRMFLLGLAFALVFGPLMIAGTDGVGDDEQGLASGLLYASVQFGAALGLPAVTAVLVAAADGGATAQTPLGGYRAALVVPLAAAALAAAVTAFGLRRRSRTAPTAPAAATGAPAGPHHPGEPAGQTAH